jgi:Tfp pilus assembly protein PilO
MTLLEELSSIDINDIGSWTRRVKIVMAAFLCIFIVGLGYKFVIEPMIESLDTVKAREPQLKQTFLEKKELAINLEEYKKQKVEAQETFNLLKEVLPNESEIPDLLRDMTQVGLSQGLQFERFRPGQNIEHDFYAEKNVDIVANGTYYQIASFVSEIAALPRIINFANFTIRRQDESSNNLSFSAVTKTYHYLDEDENQNIQ